MHKGLGLKAPRNAALESIACNTAYILEDLSCGMRAASQASANRQAAGHSSPDSCDLYYVTKIVLNMAATKTARLWQKNAII